jgi:dihydrofolate reductase
MQLTLTTFITLDGVMQAPGGPDEDRSGGFEQGGWLVPYADEDMGAFMDGVFAHADAFLLGRKTYDIFVQHWPRVTDQDDPVASALNRLPKYVVSSTLEDPSWSGTTVVRGDLAERVAELKAAPGRELQVHGSGALARSLLRLGVVDILRVLTFPVVLGAGRRLFDEGSQPTALRLVESRTTGAGTVIATYEAAGRPTYGAIGLEYED